MEEKPYINYIDLIDKNYEKVLDIVGQVFKNNKDVLARYNKVNKLTWKMEDLSGVFNSFNIFWNTLPKEAFDVDSIEKLNLRVSQFAKYILEVESNYKDHGFSLLITYYLMVCDKYLRFCHII